MPPVRPRTTPKPLMLIWALLLSLTGALCTLLSDGFSVSRSFPLLQSPSVKARITQAAQSFYTSKGEQYAAHSWSKSRLRLMYLTSIWIPSREIYFAVLRCRFVHRGSVLYATTFDSNWNELDEPFTYGPKEGMQAPGIVPISFFLMDKAKILEDKIDIPYHYVGPEDPRLYRNPQGHICLVFNMLTPKYIRRIHHFNLTLGKIEIYDSKTLFPRDKVRAQKNWIPLMIGGKTAWLYDYVDFKLLDCSVATNVRFIKPTSSVTHKSALRGGSAFVHVGEDYYLSFSYVHDHLSRYRPKFVLVQGDSFENARVVKSSGELELPFLGNVDYLVKGAIMNTSAKEAKMNTATKEAIIYTSTKEAKMNTAINYPIMNTAINYPIMNTASTNTLQGTTQISPLKASQISDSTSTPPPRIIIGTSIARLDLSQDLIVVNAFFEDKFNWSFELKGIKQFMPASTIDLHSTSRVGNLYLLSTELRDSGTCGPKCSFASWDDMVAGLPGVSGPNHHLCSPNVHVEVINVESGEKIVAKVADSCHKCRTANDISLSPLAVERLFGGGASSSRTTSTGQRRKVKWRIVSM